MAQDAELKLKVSLDLAFFRQELSTIGTQLGGQSLQLNVQFNKKSIADQYRLLGQYLERKTFKIKVESNTLDVLVAKVSTFKKNLEKLGEEIVNLGVNVESNVTKTKAAEIRRNIISDIAGPRGAVFIPIEVKPPLVKNINAIRKDIKDRLSGIVVEIETKLKGGTGLGQAAAGGVTKEVAGKRPSFLDSPAYQSELQKIAKANAQALAKAAATLPSGRNRQEVERLLQAFQTQNPQGASRTSALGAIRELIARGRYQQGLGFEASLQPIRGQRQTSAARSMPNLNQMLDRIANLTENPRAAQRMLRMMPESRLTTDLVGAANRQAAFREQYGPQGFRLPGFGGAKAFDPLLKSIAESFSDYTRTVNTSNPWMGKIGSGITTLISRALTQSPEQMFGGRAPVAGAKLLPAAGQTSGTRLIREQLERANLPLLQAPSVGQENAPLSRAATYMLNKARRALELPIGPYSPYEPNPFAGRATVPSRQYFTPTMQAALPPVGATGGRLNLLEQQLAQSRGALGTGGGVAGSLFTGRALINPGVSMLSPVGISGNYRQMAAALANQAANPELAHRQIADIGFGGVPTAATGMSGEALNRALNQAFLQRRGLGIGGGQSLPIFNTPGVAVQQNIPGMAYRMGGGGLGGSMGMFPSAGMMGPSSPLTINAQSSMFGGGGAMPPGAGGGGAGGMGGVGGFGRALGGVNLPGSGTIRELGEEFGFATKQVLLFGQAYKMLAFIQNFPAQVGAAVSQLQNFRNTLGAISPNAEEAASSNRLILDLVEKYNVPLQSARDGFTKLYASMAPAGFGGDEIRNLFTGITQAAATFGMSADKVDRVNYAFAQMASKGQVMSEELKGQLGDVLPGAMAIFAKAAGFEGPKAIQDFSAELEAGRYKGEAMVALLKNVGVVMRQEFGPGAEGAALTFQGIINRMQNSMTLLYESFEPVAVGFLNTVVVPLTDGIRQISDGFNTFFTGTAAKTSGGFGIAQELERLKPTFEGLGQNVKALIEQFGQFARAGLEVGKVLLQIAGNPFVGYLARVYAAVLPLTLAIQALNLKALIPLIASFVRAIPVFIAYTAATAQGATANKALQLAMVTTGKTAGVTATQIRTVGTAMKAAFTGTVIGAVLLGIGMLIEKIISLNASMADTKAKAMGAAQAIRSMSQTEAQQATRQYEAGAQSLKGLNDEIEQGKLKGKAWIEVTSQQAKALQDAGVIVSNVRGSLQVQPTRVTGAFQKLQGLAAEGRHRQEALSYEEKQAQQATSLAPIPAGGGEEKENEKALRDAEQLAKQEQQRRIEQANFDNDMEKLDFDYKMQLSDEAFEHQRRLIDERNQYELSGLNDIQAHQLKFAQDLKKVRLDAEDAIRKAIQKTEEAQLNVTAAQRTAQAAGVSPMGGQAIFGNTGRTSQAAGWVHGHFQTNTASLATLIGDVVPVVKKLLSQGIPVELSGGQKFNTGMSDADIAALLRKGASQHGHSGDGRSIDLFVPKGTAVPTPLSDVRNTGGRGGITGVLPGSGQSWVGHLDPRSKSGAKQSSAAFSMDTKMQKESFDLQKQYAQSANQISLQTLEIERAIQLAKEQTATVIKTNINSLFPVEQQKLDIRLQQMRHNLLMQGMPQEYIDYEEKRTIATEKAAGMTKTMIAENVEARKTLEDYNQKIAKGIELLPSQKAEMGVLNNQIKLNEQGLKDLAKAQEESNIKSLESAIATMKQADALKAMEEVSNRINDAVTGVTDTYKSMFKEIAMGGDSVEALKKAQQALADQFLTMVFDMAMKPVEESMKNTLGKMFGVPNEKEQREKTIASMEAQLAELQAHKVHLKNIDANTSIAAGKTPASGTIPAPAAPAIPGQATAAGIPGVSLAGTAALQTLPFNGQTGGMLQTLPFNGQTGGMYQNLPFPTQDTGFLSSIGINSEDMKASMSESVTAFSEQLGKFDASIADSAFAVDEAGTAMSKGGPAGKKWQESLGQVVGGLGMAAGAVMGIVAGINQVKEGGTSNVLGGIGMIASMAGSLLGGFSGLFGGGSAGQFGTSSAFNGTADALGAAPFAPKIGGVFANGGVVRGGFRAFANGGVVGGPTLGLMGEGKYNEAIVPLPDGKSIPVQLGGGSSRDLLSKGSSKQQNASPVLSMSFQTTKFGDKEYVDIGQLQAAMAETRRLAAREGAAQGSQLALNRLRNSPNTRRQLGLG